MRREIVMVGNQSFSLHPGGGAVAPATSGYPWKATPSAQLYECWNNFSVANPPNYYAYSWGPHGWEHTVGFEPGPTLATFEEVKIETRFDYSQSGPNNWWFPPDNAKGPGMQLMMYGRNGTTKHYGTYWYINQGADGLSPYLNYNDHNSKPSKGMNWQLTPVMTWTLTAHPEGGPFTLDDINDLRVGYQSRFYNGPNGKPYLQDQGSFFKLRVPYVKVTLTIEDLGGFVENVRTSSSYELRLMRRARNVVKPKGFIDQMPSAIGEKVYMTHPKGPAVGGMGWGDRKLESRAGFVLARTYEPESFTCEDEVFDLRPYSCLGWGAYRTDLPWNPEIQGLALIDRGKSYTHTRAQDAWSPRPGDGVLYRVLENYPNTSFKGLACQGGGDAVKCFRNYDTHQTGWSTVSSGGTFSAAQDTTVSLVEEAGYLSSSKLEYGAGGGKGGREKSLGSIAAGRLHINLMVKNTSVPTPASQNGEWYLHDGAKYWNNTTRAWVGSATYNAIPSDAPYGEVTADSITIPPPSTLLTGLDHAWKFDETSGNRVAVVGGVNLTDVGGVGYISGKNGNAADFNAGTDYLHGNITKYGTGTIALGGAECAFAFWVYPRSTAGYQTMLSRFNVATQGVQLIDRNGTTLRWYVGSTQHGSEPALTQDAWNFIVCQRSGDQLQVSVNGATLVNGASVTGGNLTDDRDFEVGLRSASINALDGAIDAPLIYNRPLTQAEITELYAGGTGFFHPFAGSGSYTVGVGRFSSNMGPVTLHTALFDVQYTDTTVAGARTPLVTLDAAITRKPDVHKMDQVYGRELWNPARGTAVAEVQPFWRAADLPANAVKPILHSQHITDTWDALQFVPGATDNVRFERGVLGQSTYQLDCPMTTSLTRDHILRVWARWLGAEGWNEYGPYSIQLGFLITNASTGAVVETSSKTGTVPDISALPAGVQWSLLYMRDYLGLGYDPTPRYLDGYMRMWETRLNPLSELEALWRI
jgi:hypothetical protein